MSTITVTLKEALALYDAIESVSKAEIEVDVLTGIDLAMIKKSIAPEVEGIRIADKPSAGMVEYAEKSSRLHREEESPIEEEKQQKAFNREYRQVLADEAVKDADIRKTIEDKTITVDIPLIDSKKFKGSGKNVATIIQALLPIMQLPKAKETEQPKD